jgi:hypothetical protein
MGTELEEMKAMLEKAVSKIASMEQEFRSKPAPATPQFNYDKFRTEFFLNPVATVKKMGASPIQASFVSDCFVADKLGDEAPPAMRFAASQGQQLLAAQTTQEQLAQLSQTVQALQTAALQGGKRESFKAISQMKDKYPNLTKAMSVDEGPVKAALDAFSGTAEEFAAAEEAKWAKYGLVPATPAEAPQKVADPANQSVKPGDNNGQSVKTELAVGTPKTEETPGDKKAWNADTHAELVARIVAKTAAKVN